MRLREVLYSAYERRLARSLTPTAVPRHVGVILDGNRRWAKASGAKTSHGHRAGGDKVLEFLGWCDEAGVEHVTLWLLSTDNLGRPAEELSALLAIIEDVVDRIAASGALDAYPYLHAARADLLRRLGRIGAARAAYELALGLTANAAERRFLRRRLAEVGAEAG